MNEIKAIHVTSSVSRLAGGLFVSVRHLCQNINAQPQVQNQVIGLSDERTKDDLHVWEPLQLHTHPIYGPKRFGYAPAMMKDLMASNADVVHLHGLWQFTSLAVLRWARKTGRPYSVSPHGMLEPWSLTQSRLLKRLATLLYQGPCLRGAACIRATSQLEAESIRLAGYTRNPIAVIPNGVELPRLPLPRSPRTLGQPRRALFLSRIHPKKGLLNLVKAWSTLSAQRTTGDWTLAIVGPDEGGHLAEVQAAVRAEGLQDTITFPGEVWGEEKTGLYADSDLFILPSYSENFGLVIAEALACEVPVITTRATPWQELEQHRCGWWIEVGLNPLIPVLREALSLPSSQLREMGTRGRKLIEDRYGWEPIGCQMVETYEWMLGFGPKPDCVT
jgi:glycosyltransferase involved in cell wall biosynthesis